MRSGGIRADYRDQRKAIPRGREGGGAKGWGLGGCGDASATGLHGASPSSLWRRIPLRHDPVHKNLTVGWRGEQVRGTGLLLTAGLWQHLPPGLALPSLVLNRCPVLTQPSQRFSMFAC